MNNINVLLKQTRSSMLGIGTNSVKRFLDGQINQDETALLYRFFLEVVDTSMYIDSHPSSLWYIKHRQKTALLCLLNYYTRNNYKIKHNVDEKGQEYTSFYLPKTDVPIIIHGSINEFDDIQPNSELNHKKNLESIGWSIQKVFGDDLKKKYPKYKPQYKPNYDLPKSYRLF